MLEDDEEGSSVSVKPSVEQVLEHIVPSLQKEVPIKVVESVIDVLTQSSSQSQLTAYEQLALFIIIRKSISSPLIEPNDLSALTMQIFRTKNFVPLLKRTCLQVTDECLAQMLNAEQSTISHYIKLELAWIISSIVASIDIEKDMAAFEDLFYESTELSSVSDLLVSMLQKNSPAECTESALTWLTNIMIDHEELAKSIYAKAPHLIKTVAKLVESIDKSSVDVFLTIGDFCLKVLNLRMLKSLEDMQHICWINQMLLMYPNNGDEMRSLALSML